jgi:hypothetical protein
MKSPNGTNNPKTKIKTNTRATTENKIYSHTTNWRKDKTQRSKNQKEKKNQHPQETKTIAVPKSQIQATHLHTKQH